MQSPERVEALLESLPPGTVSDELVRLAKLGAKFDAQHRRKRGPGFLSKTLWQITKDSPKPLTFGDLLDALETAAARRELYGESVSAIEKVDRIFKLVTYHHPRKGRTQATFGTIRNALTRIRKYS